MVIVIDIIINDHKCIGLIKQVDKSVEDFILAINRFDSEFAIRTHDLCLLLVKCVFIGYDEIRSNLTLRWASAQFTINV